MKVILLTDVAKIGKKGDITEVPNGYAMNQLIPLKKATPATGANLKTAEANTAAKAAGAEGMAAAFVAAKEVLSATTLEIAVTMNEQDHLFEALSAEAVVSAAKTAGANITADMVQFAESVKTAGEHAVKLTSADLSTNFTINVTKAA